MCVCLGIITTQSADALAQAVCVQVYHLAGGIDPEPLV
jgi:hypothetical protein